MSLAPCAECGTPVSSQAKACPNCGSVKFKHKVARKRNWPLMAVLIVGGVVSVTYLQQTAQEERAQRQAAKTPQMLAADAARREQAALTAAAVKVLRGTMKDPTAFELTEAYAGQSGAGCIAYRGKNSFGAMFPGHAVARSDKIILVEERDANRFVAAWNKSCLTEGENLKAMVEYVADLK